MKRTKLTRRQRTLKVFVTIAVGLAISGMALPAKAEPKGPNGEKCSSSETGVKHDIKGVTYTCDKCVYSKCDTSGGQISNCQQVTYWSNCVAASVSTPFGPARAGGVLQNAPVNPGAPSTTAPKAPTTGATTNKQ